MREIVVAVDSQDTIKLGYLGENNFQVVRFDIADWLRDHKNGQAVLLFKVNGMDAPYPCKVEIQGKYANWILTKADLQYGRNGRCQLFYYADGEVVAKSSIFYTDVANSLGEQTTQPPESFTNWLNDVLTASSEAEDAAKSAKQIQQQMNETLQSAEQTFDTALRQGLSSMEDAKEQVAQTAKQSVSRLDETADAAHKTVLDTLTEGLHQIDTAQIQVVTAVTEEGDRQAERLDALVPDGYYSKEESDQRYAQIDDTKIGITAAWSSENIVQKLCPPFTTEGAIVTCNPVESSRLNAVVQIEPVQEGEGDPSPENVRPIRGWEAVNVFLYGKNLFPNFIKDTDYPGGSTVKVNADGSITIHKVAGESIKQSAKIALPAGEYIIWNGLGSGNKIYLQIGWYTIATTINTAAMTYKHSGGEIDLYLYSDTQTTGDITIFPTLIPFGMELLYKPYHGETFTIPLGQTMCGGMLNVTTGVLTRTHENIPSYAGEDVGDDWISSTGGLTNGAQVVYRLLRPEIIQLDPVEITAFSGVNTVYADTGDVTVSGYSDPNNIINVLADRISTLEQNAIGG